MGIIKTMILIDIDDESAGRDVSDSLLWWTVSVVAEDVDCR